MPTYRVQTPEGNFKVESPDALSDEQLLGMVGGGQPAANPFEEPTTPSGGGYFERVGRRVGEAGSAAFDVITGSAPLDVITGGEKADSKLQCAYFKA